MFMPAGKETLEWADVYPFLYLHEAYAGLRESAVIRNLVVDGMQDYTPVQYAVLNQIFECRKTILGDYGQLINPNHPHSLEIFHLDGIKSETAPAASPTPPRPMPRASTGELQLW